MEFNFKIHFILSKSDCKTASKNIGYDFISLSTGSE